LSYTAGITNLLVPKRSVVVCLYKSPNRLRAVDLVHSIFSGNVGIHRNGTR
jgi:hypothetical protein